MAGQTLEWLQLVAEAKGRQRAIDLLENSYAARAGQATEDGFKDFVRELKSKIK